MTTEKIFIIRHINLLVVQLLVRISEVGYGRVSGYEEEAGDCEMCHRDRHHGEEDVNGENGQPRHVARTVEKKIVIKKIT